MSCGAIVRSTETSISSSNSSAAYGGAAAERAQTSSFLGVSERHRPSGNALFSACGTQARKVCSALASMIHGVASSNGAPRLVAPGAEIHRCAWTVRLSVSPLSLCTGRVSELCWALPWPPHARGWQVTPSPVKYSCAAFGRHVIFARRVSSPQLKLSNPGPSHRSVRLIPCCGAILSSPTRTYADGAVSQEQIL